jgi:hypothetical protein
MSVTIELLKETSITFFRIWRIFDTNILQILKNVIEVSLSNSIVTDIDNDLSSFLNYFESME